MAILACMIATTPFHIAPMLRLDTTGEYEPGFEEIVAFARA